MSDSDKKFTGTIAEFYDRYMVPMVFAPYAQDMAGRLARIAPHLILETAAGTGVLTGELSMILPDAEITATDLNPAMLEVAARKFPERNILWKSCDATSLPFADGSFDAVAAQFGAMFFPEKVTAYREAHRVLKPRGTLIFSVWDRLEHNLFHKIVADIAASCFPEDPPDFFNRTPFGYNDVEAIEQELRSAGFSSIAWDRVTQLTKAASSREAAMALCQGTPLRNEIEARDKSKLEFVTDAAAAALAAKFGQGPIAGDGRAIVFTAMR